MSSANAAGSDHGTAPPPIASGSCMIAVPRSGMWRRPSASSTRSTAIVRGDRAKDAGLAMWFLSRYLEVLFVKPHNVKRKEET
jgi:hypothetical protein